MSFPSNYLLSTLKGEKLERTCPRHKTCWFDPQKLGEISTCFYGLNPQRICHDNISYPQDRAGFPLYPHDIPSISKLRVNPHFHWRHPYLD